MEYTYDILQRKYAYGVMQLSHKIFNVMERFNSLESVYVYDNQGFVAKINEKIVGYITFAILHNSEESDVYKNPNFTITTLGVDPEYQKQGIGKNLLKEIRNYFRKTYGYMRRIHNIQDIIYLHVRMGNHNAKALYDKAGFEMVEILEKYYTEPQEDGIYMKYKMGFTLASNDECKTDK